MPWSDGWAHDIDELDHATGDNKKGIVAPKQTFFPTCQVRVVRFYVCSPLPPLPPPPPSVGSAGPHRGSSKCSVQRRTSIASSRLQWAAPDLNRGALERTGQRRTSTGELWSGLWSVRNYLLRGDHGPFCLGWCEKFRCSVLLALSGFQQAGLQVWCFDNLDTFWPPLLWGLGLRTLWGHMAVWNSGFTDMERHHQDFAWPMSIGSCRRMEGMDGSNHDDFSHRFFNCSV